jgi:hypothetical protein
VLSATNWNSLHAFLRDFYGQVENDKVASEEARKLRESFGGTVYESKKFEAGVDTPVATQKHSGAPHSARIQAVVDFREEMGQEFADVFDDAWFEKQLEDAETIEFDHSLQALQSPPPSKPASSPFVPSSPGNKDPFTCILKVLYGTCNKPGCKYDHREDPVHKTRIKYLDLLQKQLSQSKPSGGQRFHQRASNLDAADEEDNEY